MIKQRTLGRTGLKVSELSLGTMNFGWKTNEEESFAILDAYREAGGNFIQATGQSSAAPIFAASTTQSEEFVGRWWRSRAIPRGELFLATRLQLGFPPEGTSLVKFARDSVRESLHRLKATYLDLVVFEWSEALLPARDMMAVFDALVRGGLVRYIGAANFPAWRVTDAIGRAYLQNHSRMEMLQSDYSLMTRARFEPEAMSLCGEQRLGFVARSPLAGGFLARWKEFNYLNSSRRDWVEQRFGNAYGDVGLAAVGDVAARHDASSAQVALAWVLHNPAVTSALVGVRSPRQLHELVGAGQVRLAALDLAQLADATAAEEVRLPGSPAIPAVAEPELALI
jgi:aryl-alcohol dehydrogenase-like predicted oxidoreductase